MHSLKLFEDQTRRSLHLQPGLQTDNSGNRLLFISDLGSKSEHVTL